jgi:AcrR family transcriptional regulator
VGERTGNGDRETAIESGIQRRRKAALADGGKEYLQRRLELVSAAADVFRERGYADATLNDIAARVGADRASLYYYVGGKEELFREAVRGVVESNLSEVARIVASDAGPDRKLRLIVNTLISSYEQNYPHMYVYIQEEMRRVGIDDSEWAREMTTYTREFEASTIGLVKECIAAGIFRDDVRADLAINALYGMLQWTHRWFIPGPELSAVEMADAFWAIFVDGMGAPSK